MSEQRSATEVLNPRRRESLDPRLRLRQLPAVARRVVQHPAWVKENLWLLRMRRADAERPFSLADHAEHVMDERTAVLAVLGVTAAQYDAAKNALWTPPRDPDAPSAIQDARQSLQSLVSVVVRLRQPQVMVETGVARGFTTAVALRAMADNGVGMLHSVDLPALEHDQRLPTGEVIPEDVRDRWDLTLGPSRLALPPLVERVAPIDVFLHDADHTWASQITEYRTVWPALRPGGLILADDVYNDAFLAFAAEVGVRPHLIGDVAANNAIGLLAKPS